MRSWKQSRRRSPSVLLWAGLLALALGPLGACGDNGGGGDGLDRGRAHGAGECGKALDGGDGAVHGRGVEATGAGKIGAEAAQDLLVVERERRPVDGVENDQADRIGTDVDDRGGPRRARGARHRGRRQQLKAWRRQAVECAGRGAAIRRAPRGWGWS